ncbi:MFS family permease [Pseudomonas sp. PvP046]
MRTRTLEGAASLVTPSRKRFFIMVLLFITVVINYLDRSNLSIAAPALTSELGLDPVHVGLIFSAFGWTYAAMQLPGGWLVDRVPPRILYTAALLLWSIATIMLGFAASFIALFVLRMAVGALEAPAYPINSRVVTTWFPERERATAIGVYTSGQFVGLAFLTPVLAWLQAHYGWHMVFVATGGVGVLWALIWYTVYREPRDFKGVNQQEIELIQEGGRAGGHPEGCRKTEAGVQLAGPGYCVEQAQAVGHLPGAVLPELDAVVFPDLVPDLPGEIPGYGLHQVWPAGVVAVPRRIRRCAVLGLLFRLADPSRA